MGSGVEVGGENRGRRQRHEATLCRVGDLE